MRALAISHHAVYIAARGARIFYDTFAKLANPAGRHAGPAVSCRAGQLLRPLLPFDCQHHRARRDAPDRNADGLAAVMLFLQLRTGATAASGRAGASGIAHSAGRRAGLMVGRATAHRLRARLWLVSRSAHPAGRGGKLRSILSRCARRASGSPPQREDVLWRW